MGKKSEKALSNLIAGVLVIALVLWLIAKFPVWAFIIVALCVAGAVLKPTKCQICGNPLGRKVHTWDVDGKNKRVCAHCNQTLERRHSSHAMKFHK